MASLREINLLSIPVLHTAARRSQVSTVSPLSQAIQVLQEHPSRRKEPQIDLLSSYLANIKFFAELQAKMQVEVVKTCCKYLTYEAWRRGEIVFHRGDPGTKFFILLSGCAGIYVRPPPSNSPEDRQSELKEVKEVHPGDSFGELALITNANRAATVQCKSDCHFAVLDKADYLRILGKLEHIRLGEVVDFLLSLPLFSGWGKQAAQRISYYFTPITYIRKQCVYRSNETPTHVYIIKSGEFEISQDIAKSMEGIKQPKLGTKQLFHKYQVTILGRGELFGDKEIVEESLRLYTCSCLSSTGTLLVMSKEDFVTRVLSDGGKSKLKLLNVAKSNLRESRVQRVISLNSGNQVCRTPAVIMPKLQPRKHSAAAAVVPRKAKALMAAEWKNILKKMAKKRTVFRDRIVTEHTPIIVERRLSKNSSFHIPELRFSLPQVSPRSFANSPSNHSFNQQSDESGSFERSGSFKSDLEDDSRDLLSKTMYVRPRVVEPRRSINWSNSLRKRSYVDH